jgi:hypothetical protein
MSEHPSGQACPFAPSDKRSKRPWRFTDVAEDPPDESRTGHEVGGALA